MRGNILKAIFALAVIIQVLLLGIPEGHSNPDAGLDSFLQPLTDVVWGFALYAVRALLVTIVAAFFVYRM